MLPLSDCEPVGDGLLLQPVNTLTALAYVAAGAWLLLASRGAARPWPTRAYAAAVTAVGVGSVLYHGAGGGLARGAHDWSLALLGAALVAISVWAWRRRRRGPGGRLWLAAAAGAAGLPFQLLGRTGGPLCAGGAVPAHGLWHLLTAVALAAAGSGLLRMTR